MDIIHAGTVRPELRGIVLERMRILMDSAVSNARSCPRLAERHAMLAKRLSSRHNVRMPYQMRIAFCKKCKSFIAAGANSRIRMGGETPKSVRVSCKLCGHVYRKIIST